MRIDIRRIGNDRHVPGRVRLLYGCQYDGDAVVGQYAGIALLELHGLGHFLSERHFDDTVVRYGLSIYSKNSTIRVRLICYQEAEITIRIHIRCVPQFQDIVHRRTGRYIRHKRIDHFYLRFLHLHGALHDDVLFGRLKIASIDGSLIRIRGLPATGTEDRSVIRRLHIHQDHGGIYILTILIFHAWNRITRMVFFPLLIGNLLLLFFKDIYRKGIRDIIIPECIAEGCRRICRSIVFHMRATAGGGHNIQLQTQTIKLPSRCISYNSRSKRISAVGVRMRYLGCSGNGLSAAGVKRIVGYRVRFFQFGTLLKHPNLCFLIITKETFPGFNLPGIVIYHILRHRHRRRLQGFIGTLRSKKRIIPR